MFVVIIVNIMRHNASRPYFLLVETNPYISPAQKRDNHTKLGKKLQVNRYINIRPYDIEEICYHILTKCKNSI